MNTTNHRGIQTSNWSCQVATRNELEYLPYTTLKYVLLCSALSRLLSWKSRRRALNQTCSNTQGNFLGVVFFHVHYGLSAHRNSPQIWCTIYVRPCEVYVRLILYGEKPLQYTRKPSKGIFLCLSKSATAIYSKANNAVFSRRCRKSIVVSLVLTLIVT